MEKLEKLTNYKITDQKLLKQALTHKSHDKKVHNERLEFLGDAVLNLLIADFLMERYPQASEGDLTKWRSHLVSGSNLAKIAIEFDFPKCLKTEAESHKSNHRILAGALEAYIGAVYLDGGFLSAKQWIQKLFQNRLDQNLHESNHKSILQEWCQKKYKEPPLYKVEKEEGLEHKKTFFVNVFIKDKCYGIGSSHQKKQAEQKAAEQALKKLKISFNKYIDPG